MVELNFYISDEDFDMLAELKELDEKNELTFNEYAAMLLSQKIHSQKSLHKTNGRRD